MFWGARLGCTTLTANRTGIKATVKEIDLRQRVVVFGDGEAVDVRENAADAMDNTRGGVQSLTTSTGISGATIWIINPGSLAGGMRSSSDSASDIWHSRFSPPVLRMESIIASTTYNAISE
uniref:Uncharacterized protein n=1 Tax=Moniliophthora roreri TaxID=221103 RepID=A0A0W0FDB3_MONRR